MYTDIDTTGQGNGLAYHSDDFTDGWRSVTHVMLLHGIAESGQAFAGWVPHLARHYHVLRPDLRGHGRSASVHPGETLSVSQLADDIQELAARLDLQHVHVVGAKLGAQVALELAQRRVSWMSTLTLAGILISPSGALGKWLSEWTQLVEEQGVEGWARATMPGRMGNALPREGYEWWIAYMAQTKVDTVRACFRLIAQSSEPSRLESIACPTQVIAAVLPANAEAFSQQPSVQDIFRWAKRIPQGRVVELPADSYHIAATHPDACATITAAFIKEYGK